MKARTWRCVLCPDAVSELGAYAKLSATKYAHLSCYNKEVILEGRRELLREQAEAQELLARENAAREAERQAHERAEFERRQEIQERERTNRIQAALNNPLPAKVEPKRPDAPKEEAPRKDRFDLIDIK